ncbi:MAG TPA: hypothetical protein VHB97_23000 [Polyangia bacterium]|jgi:hypothetical protein|nr:hypothetical protein [Polyangia bacterium]
MTDVNTLKRYFERALALAHAAVDEPTAERVADARAIGYEVLLLASRARPAAATLTDGRELFEHASQLRTLLALLTNDASMSA